MFAGTEETMETSW